MIVPRLHSLAVAVEAAAEQNLEISSTFLKMHCETEDLEIVEELKMQVDSEAQRISAISDFLPRLKKLVLSNSRVPCVRDLGTRWNCLLILNLSRAEVADLSGLSAFPNLAELYTPFNSIALLQPLLGCDNLEIVDFEGNCISDFNELQYLNMCPKLVNVNLQGNPVEISRSRKEILAQLPSVTVFDDVHVQSEEAHVDSVSETELLESLRGRKEIQPSTARGSEMSTARTRMSTADGNFSSELTMSGHAFHGNPIEAIRFRKKLNK